MSIHAEGSDGEQLLAAPFRRTCRAKTRACCRLTCGSAAARRDVMRAAGAHVSTYHGPLQPHVMCACHRTSPTATPLACDGLYLRERRRTKGTTLNEADDLHGLPPRQRRDRRLFNRTLAHPIYGRERSRARARAFVRATGGHAAVNEDSTERPEAGDAQPRSNAAALAAGVLIERAVAAAPRERRVFSASERIGFNAPTLF